MGMWMVQEYVELTLERCCAADSAELKLSFTSVDVQLLAAKAATAAATLVVPDSCWQPKQVTRIIKW
jgi:hypothetical protein